MSEEKSVRPGFFKGMTRLQKKIEKLVGPSTPEEKLAIRQGTKKLKQALKDMAPFVEEVSKPKATEKRKKAEAEAAASEPIRDLTRAIGDLHRDLQRQEMRRIEDIILSESDEAGESKSAQGVKKGEPTPEQGANRGNANNPSLATWDAIEISFLSDERVQIRNGTNSETRNYGELGFEDCRNGKPNRAWLTLRALAEARGIIRNAAKTGGDWSKVERRMQEIRKALRSRFGISADPVPFVHGTGYQALFKIVCAPSFRT